MSKLAVKAHKLKDRAFSNWDSEVAGRWRIQDLRADEAYCNDWISLDTLTWDDKRKQLYVGLTAINTDILHQFDPATGQFQSLGFQRVSDKFDVKLHRSIELAPDGTLFLATALLHDMDEQREAKGGKLLHYDPDMDKYTLLAVPVDRNYIQSIRLDPVNRIVYGFTYPAEMWFRYDLDSGKVDTMYIGNGVMICQAHCSVLDRKNRLWATWGESRAFENDGGPAPIRLFCYNPATNEFTWYQHGFSTVYPGDTGRVDHMLLADDGQIYAGTLAGTFCRLDPATGEVTYIGKPYPNWRLAGLVQASDGLIYGAGNGGYDAQHRGTTRLFVYDPRTTILKDLGPIFDAEIGNGASNIHMLVEGESGVLYAGENDNIWRSSYLWECRVNG